MPRQVSPLLPLLLLVAYLSVATAMPIVRAGVSGGTGTGTGNEKRQLVVEPSTMACKPCTVEGVKWCVRCSMSLGMQCSNEFSIPCGFGLDAEAAELPRQGMDDDGN